MSRSLSAAANSWGSLLILVWMRSRRWALEASADLGDRILGCLVVLSWLGFSFILAELDDSP